MMDDKSKSLDGVKNSKGILLKADHIVKIYGSTIAINELELSIQSGDVVGLVGANGAGKSTLMRVISGVTCPDSGMMEYCGKKIDWARYSPSNASMSGIRVVYQELSLCDNLKVYENFYIELPHLFKHTISWRKKAQKLALEQLDLVFPGHGIDVCSDMTKLSIAQQQMVEIARAFSDAELKLLILDEPTSSLPVEQTNQLLEYIKKKASEGMTFIYISHRLFEIMDITNKIYVMKNGSIQWSGPTDKTCEEEMIHLMGSGADTLSYEKTIASEKEESSLSDKVNITCKNLSSGTLKNINCKLYGGEIIGIAGLEGNGQRDLLKLLFHPSIKERRGIEIKGTVAYVTGNRKEEGNFPLWSILSNMVITSLSRGGLFRAISTRKVREQAIAWYDRLRVKGAGVHMGITSLSGGNQQKVLIARALLSDADIIILDDPTRGVDVETKNQLYEVFAQATAKGKLVIWYSSDDSEFSICSRVMVMRYGTIVTELNQDEITKDNIIEASFKAKQTNKEEKKKNSRRKLISGDNIIPLASMLLVYLISGSIHNSAFTLFGVELLISGALPLIFAALGQTFIIGLSHFDFGIGSYMGLISVISATLLFSNPFIGLLAILGILLLYSSMGVLIYYRNIPPVIVTLGASFIWTGIAYTLQGMPGGQSPEWLSSIFSQQILHIPSVLVIGLLGMLGAWGIYRSRYGTVMRGFGNHEVSMMRSGWSKLKAYWFTYLSAGFFGLLGGMTFTAITSSSDAKAMDSYTMLTTAAVIIGGGTLSGGRVSHIGAVFGAITLSLVTILLGFLQVSSDYTAAVQGIILLVILSLRLFRKGEKK